MKELRNGKHVIRDDVTINFLKNLIDIIKSKNMTIMQVANKVGVTDTRIYCYRAGSAFPLLGILMKLAKVLDYDLSASKNYEVYYGLNNLNDETLKKKYKNRAELDGPTEKFLTSIQELANAKKMSLKELGRRAGISNSAICQYKRLEMLPSLPVLHALLKALEYDLDSPINKEKFKKYLKNSEPAKKFVAGKVYTICEKGNCAKDAETLNGVSWSNLIPFEYLGKKGIHHYFKAVKGGWSRTYTDPQLVDKKIMEVEL